MHSGSAKHYNTTRLRLPSTDLNLDAVAGRVENVYPFHGRHSLRGRIFTRSAGFLA
jgi:hypothetical protein